MATRMDYIEIKITQSMISMARERLGRVPNNPNIVRDLSKFNSEPERTIEGYIGEEMVMPYFGVSSCVDDLNYDFIYNGKRCEVKTITCGFQPPPYYLATVNSYDLTGVHKQQADYYIFTRTLYNHSLGWIVGYMPCGDFFQHGIFVQKGTTYAGMTFEKANATVMEIKQIKSVAELMEPAPSPPPKDTNPKKPEQMKLF